MHPFAKGGTVHELILKSCPLERVMRENRTTTETNSRHGALSLVCEVSHCWGREYSFDYALLNYFCKNSFRQEAMTSHRLFLSRTSPPNSQSLFYFFCQSESNILRYLKPVLFINCHFTSIKFPIVILNLDSLL